jgi:hypothetical protein
MSVLKLPFFFGSDVYTAQGRRFIAAYRLQGFTPMMKTARTSEMTVNFYDIIRRNTKEDIFKPAAVRTCKLTIKKLRNCFFADMICPLQFSAVKVESRWDLAWLPLLCWLTTKKRRTGCGLYKSCWRDKHDFTVSASCCRAGPVHVCNAITGSLFIC